MDLFTGPEWEKKFRSIFADIRQNKCVVLVGPEAVRLGSRPLLHRLREQLLRTNAEDIAHFYEQDEFFLFRDKIAKEDIQREVILFYQAHGLQSGISEFPLLDLIRLRVHLILSINPDAFLSDLAYKYGIKHRFAFFQHGGTAVQDVESPGPDMPLFYNLYGSLERDNSLVLDYDDLFELLSSLFGTPGLPPRILIELRQAKHFLFVGFNFNKWYSQLLLRVLSGEKAIRKFVIDHSEKSPNTSTFLIKQFGIEFIEDEDAFLAELFRRARTEGLLRPVIEAHTPETDRIAHLLRIGDVENALQVLLSKPAWREGAAQLAARYRELRDQEGKKLLDFRENALEYNRIVDAILESILVPA